MSTSTHPFAPEEVMAFADGELSPEQAPAVSSHLQTCAGCFAVVADFRNLSNQMNTWQIARFPESLREAPTAAQLGRDEKAIPFFDNVARWPLRWFVIAVSGVAALLFLLAITTPRSMRSRMAASEAASRGAVGEKRRDVPVDLAKSPTSRVTLSERGRNQVDLGGVLGGLSVNQPMIARTVSLSIVVKDFDAGRASLEAILARHNGYAASLNVGIPQGSARTLQASLRIPAPELAVAMSELKALGRVENETQSGEEVTQQHADLLARLKNSRETEQRLQDVLRTRTGKVKDVLEVEQEIARVRGEIEQMEAEQKTLEHRVEFAVIDLKLAEEYKAQLNTPAPSVLMQLRNAEVNGFRNAFESLLALALFLAESGPSLLLWLALLGIPAWRLWKRYRRAQSLGSLAGA